MIVSVLVKWLKDIGKMAYTKFVIVKDICKMCCCEIATAKHNKAWIVFIIIVAYCGIGHSCGIWMSSWRIEYIYIYLISNIFL